MQSNAFRALSRRWTQCAPRRTPVTPRTGSRSVDDSARQLASTELNAETAGHGAETAADCSRGRNRATRPAGDLLCTAAGRHSGESTIQSGEKFYNFMKSERTQ